MNIVSKAFAAIAATLGANNLNFQENVPLALKETVGFCLDGESGLCFDLSALCGYGAFEVVPPTRKNDRVCQKISALCTDEEYEHVSPKYNNDRVCKGLSPLCGYGTFEVVPPTQKNDRICLEVSAVCTDEEYEHASPKYNSDRVCKDLSPICGYGAFELVPPTQKSDRICLGVSALCTDEEYEYASPKYNSDRVCKDLSPLCGYGAFEVVPPTRKNDRVCQEVSALCTDEEYEHASPKYNSDRVCQDLSPLCGYGKYETYRPTKYSDRVCQNLSPLCGYGSYEAGPPSYYSDRICQDLSPSCDRESFEVQRPTYNKDRICQEYPWITFFKKLIKYISSFIKNYWCSEWFLENLDFYGFCLVLAVILDFFLGIIRFPPPKIILCCPALRKKPIISQRFRLFCFYRLGMGEDQVVKRLTYFGFWLAVKQIKSRQLHGRFPFLDHPLCFEIVVAACGISSIFKENGRPAIQKEIVFVPLAEFKKKMEDVQPKGLVNGDNSCYMNSVLQCLINNLYLSKYFWSGAHEINLKPCLNPRCCGEDGPSKMKCYNKLVRAYAVLVSSNWGCDNKILDSYGQPIKAETLFKNSVRGHLPAFDNYEQQDVTEFCMKLFEAFHIALNRDSATKPEMGELTRDANGNYDADSQWKHDKFNNDSTIYDLFQGQCCNSFTCKICGATSKKFDMFTTLELSLPEGDEPTTLVDCIKNYSNTDAFEWDCYNCKTRVDAEQRMELFRLPAFLVILLKRHEYIGSTVVKDNIVDFPPSLNMREFVKGMGNDILNYDLDGVVSHIGVGADSGHYISYNRHSINGKWYRYNDLNANLAEAPYNLNSLQKKTNDPNLSEGEQPTKKRREVIDKLIDAEFERDTRKAIEKSIKEEFERDTRKAIEKSIKEQFDKDMKEAIMMSLCEQSVINKRLKAAHGERPYMLFYSRRDVQAQLDQHRE